MRSVPRSSEHDISKNLKKSTAQNRCKFILANASFDENAGKGSIMHLKGNQGLQANYRSPKRLGGPLGGRGGPGGVREDVFPLFYADSKKHIFDKIRELFSHFDLKLFEDQPTPPLPSPRPPPLSMATAGMSS